MWVSWWCSRECFWANFLTSYYILLLRLAHDKVSRHPSWCWLKMFKSSQSSYPIHGWYGDWRCGKPHQKRHHINMWLTFGLFAAGMLFIKFCWDVSAGFRKGIEWHQRTGHDCSVASVSTDIRQGNAAEGASWQCQKWFEQKDWNQSCFGIMCALYWKFMAFQQFSTQVARRFGLLPRDDSEVDCQEMITIIMYHKWYSRRFSSDDQCSNIFDIV